MNAMKKQFKIVEGAFTPSETAEVLFTLINDKIKYHNLQITEITERFGGDTSHSERRIKELQESKEQIKELIIAARDNGQTINIHGTIVLDVNVHEENAATTLS
ncbi:hypothetical protein [Sediminicola sp. 1XM1-17]|uniref:hypothetical protein n=1 Tax=Sediminicola sp. 1XM1-17 TaxID=3127702 RepID=UPI003078314B